MNHAGSHQSGFSFVEALIVAAIAATIFAGLFGTFRYTFELLANAKAKTTAVTIANERMEYFRSLPYSDVGTIAGIPPGTIPQNSTSTLNNIVFTERVLVEFVDDPADGMLTATTTDSNGIPADYKRVKIEVSWTLKGETNSIFLTSNIVPRSIETTDGGGTVRVNVVNADGTPLQGAQVQLINDTATPSINVTKGTDSSGIALFSGAPAASNYQVIVTAPGYSTDRTYQATVANPNPITAPFSVLEADISTVTFQIGELSDVAITAYSAITDSEVLEPFTDTSGILIISNTAVTGGTLRLAQTAGTYASAGSAVLTAVAPSVLEAWGAATIAAMVPSGTAYRVQVGIVASSTFELIPDAVLPGNSAGFSTSYIDLSALSVAVYPSISLRISLSTTNTAVTPQIDELAVYFREVASPRSGTLLSLRGNKVIGTDLSANQIYKTVLSGTTNSSGRLSFSNVEFDSYAVTIPSGLMVSTACPALPLSHLAGIDSSLTLVLRSTVPHSLRTTVVSQSGSPVPGATVTLSRSGFSATEKTNLCGQVFIHSGVVPEVDYEVSVQKAGYVTQTIPTVSINGATDSIVTLQPQ